MNLCVILVLCGLFHADPDTVVIRGIYINPYQAAKKSYLEQVFLKADSGLINTIIVDFKSDYGFLAYPSKIELAEEMGAIKRYIDVDYLLENAALHDLKVIARIVCFRDDYLGHYDDYGIQDDSGEVWLDKNGLAWTNPYKKEVREYLLDVTKEITELGIKSVAFDYIRFPTDGAIERIKLSDVTGPRSAPILEFLKAVKEEFQSEIEIGVCVFGFAVWHALKTEGQIIEKMAEYVDVLYPMLYPSHFGWSFKREMNEYWRNYWIYFDSVEEAKRKLPDRVKVIPFVQGFDLRAESFDSDYVSAQIYGALAADADGFLIWHAGGDYSISWTSLLSVRSSILRQFAQIDLNNRMKEEGRRYQDIALHPVSALWKTQKKNLTTDRIHSRIDNLPSGKIPRTSTGIHRSFLDPVLP